MRGRIGIGALLASAALGDGGAAAAPFRPLPDQEKPSAPRVHDPAALPFAQGRRFATLDEYLAFRRSRGAIDLPWYKEVAPGIFELQTTVKPAPPARRFTRAELARSFGFER